MSQSYSGTDTPLRQVRPSRSLLQSLKNHGLVVAVLVMGFALRLIYLDADPDYYAWTGYITDEGRWLRNARQVALFGRVLDPDRGLHIHLAPLFHLAHTLVFKVLGVSFVTARLLTALSGCALLVVAWVVLRRHASRQALLVALMLLAFEVDLIVMSRVGIPEMLAMFFQLAAFAALMTPLPGSARFVAAGFGLLLAVAIKATVLPIVPIFALVVGLPGGRRMGQRLRDLAMFGMGLCGPVVPVVVVWLIRRGGQVQDEAMRNSARVVRGFIEPSDLYGIASLPFDSTLAPVLNTWGVAACLAFVGWMVRSRESTSSAAHRCYTASLIWVSAYALVMTGLAYFPDRYKIHLLVPLAVNIAAGLTLFQKASLAGAADTLRSMQTTRRLGALAAFALPTAVFWAPLLASGYSLVGGNAAHLRVWIASVAAALVMTVAMLEWRLRCGRSLFPFVVFPVAAALAWLVCDRLQLTGVPFWPVPEHGPWTWTLRGGWVILPAAWALAHVLARQAPAWRVGIIPVVAAVYAVLSLVRVLPSYVTPQYTMKHASEGLGRDLAGFGGVVGSRRADGLFNANRLRYNSAPASGEWKPDVLVVASFNPRDLKLDGDYRLVTQYDLFVSPLYVPPAGGSAEHAPSRLPVRVYLRTPGTSALPEVRTPLHR